MEDELFSFNLCRKCRCYRCRYNAHAKPDEMCGAYVGRILKIPVKKKCIGCSYCYVNQRQTQRTGCCFYKEGE